MYRWSRWLCYSSILLSGSSYYRKLGWGVFHEVDLFYGPPSASPAAVENRKQGGWHFQRKKETEMKNDQLVCYHIE